MEPTRTNRPQIDGLRAFAVMAVLYSHVWTNSNYGHLGVRLFFVISGFLITGILVDARALTPRGGLGQVFKVFYCRRALRIFPAYYFILLLLLILSVAAGFRDLGQLRSWDDDFFAKFPGLLPWYATYTANILFMLEGKWPLLTGHFWTLSVEEQFYLLWPLLVLTIPLRHLRLSFCTVALLAVAFRLTVFPVAPHSLAIWVATPASFDALAAGALLALWQRTGRPVSAVRIQWLLVPAFLACVMWGRLATPALDYVAGEALWLVPLSLLVAGASAGFGGILALLLQNRVSLFVGRISYGIYLYHILVRFLLERASAALGLDLPFWKGSFTFVLVASTTIGVAAASWYFLERPINRLKSRLPYPSRSIPAQP